MKSLARQATVTVFRDGAPWVNAVRITADRGVVYASAAHAFDEDERQRRRLRAGQSDEIARRLPHQFSIHHLGDQAGSLSLGDVTGIGVTRGRRGIDEYDLTLLGVSALSPELNSQPSLAFGFEDALSGLEGIEVFSANTPDVTGFQPNAFTGVYVGLGIQYTSAWHMQNVFVRPADRNPCGQGASGSPAVLPDGRLLGVLRSSLLTPDLPRGDDEYTEMDEAFREAEDRVNVSAGSTESAVCQFSAIDRSAVEAQLRSLAPP